jgi:magnesium and cobalt exporter, CNNM family
VQPLPDGGWSVSGQLHRDEFAELFGVDPPAGHYDTLAGLVLERLGRMPEPGDSVQVGGATITVDRIDGHRIDRVLLRPPSTPDRPAPAPPGGPG